MIRPGRPPVVSLDEAHLRPGSPVWARFQGHGAIRSIGNDSQVEGAERIAGSGIQRTRARAYRGMRRLLVIRHGLLRRLTRSTGSP